eukprot:COSAG01_NODE_40579_length_462_cov_0.608815_1_plen_62_part_10
MPPQITSTTARKIQAVHRGRLARKDYDMLKRVQQRTAYKHYISSNGDVGCGQYATSAPNSWH